MCAQVKHRVLLPLILTQALSAFNSNQLRAVLLILVSFRGLRAFGLSAETTVGLSTIFVVAPYVILSIPAGRICDRFSKTLVLRCCKGFEIAIFVVAALGLYSQSVPLILLCLLMTGVEAAIMGPAKLSVIPELAGTEHLVSANAWMSATNTAAILFGVISGNLLITNDVPISIIAVAGIAIAIAGFVSSLLIRSTTASAPRLSMKAGAFALDFATSFSWLKRVPLAIAPIAGISWFWFQGAVNTTLFPLYVKQAVGQPESLVVALFVVASAGVAAGALLCRMAGDRIQSASVPLLAFALAAISGADLGFNGLTSVPGSALRVLADIFLLAIATGFYIVPLAAALQAVAPETERARFIGLCNTVIGFAMILSGSTVILALNLDIEIGQMFFYGAVISGLIAFITLSNSLRALQIHLKPEQ